MTRQGLPITYSRAFQGKFLSLSNESKAAVSQFYVHLPLPPHLPRAVLGRTLFLATALNPNLTQSFQPHACLFIPALYHATQFYRRDLAPVHTAAHFKARRAALMVVGI